jgi:hypothetical protein
MKIPLAAGYGRAHRVKNQNTKGLLSFLPSAQCSLPYAKKRTNQM